MQDAASQQEVSLNYTVPLQFNSARQLVDDQSVPAEECDRLMRVIAALEENVGTVIDQLITDDERGEKGGITIFFDPVDEGDMETKDFFDSTFESMWRTASHLPDPTEQSRTILEPALNFGFDRMDVVNAYGAEGSYASFLTRDEKGYSIDLIIITNRDPHAPHFYAVIQSLKVIESTSP